MENIDIDNEILENIDIDKKILENIDIDKEIFENIDIDKEIFENIDIDKILNRLEFGISNRAKGDQWLCEIVFPSQITNSQMTKA